MGEEIISIVESFSGLCYSLDDVIKLYPQKGRAAGIFLNIASHVKCYFLSQLSIIIIFHPFQ